MDKLISLKNISKSFGTNNVLNNISFDINAGQVIALLGRSGCGKSTLIKILVGFYATDSGQIEFLLKNHGELKKIVGYTTQENSFYEKLTVYENMQYYANLYGCYDERRINTILKDVKLYDAKDSSAESISGGMKRRLDFAISLVHNPKFIILDEPTTGLDPALVENFWDIVLTISKNQNISVLVTTHILSEVSNHCDRALFMKKGTITKDITITKNTNIEKEFMKYT